MSDFLQPGLCPWGSPGNSPGIHRFIWKWAFSPVSYPLPIIKMVSYLKLSIIWDLGSQPWSFHSVKIYLIINVKSEVKSLSRVWLFATPWTVAYHAPPSMGFSRQEHRSGLPFPSPNNKCISMHLFFCSLTFICIW